MSTEKFQFPPQVPEVGARVRITETMTNPVGNEETYVEEATVTSRYAQSFGNQPGTNYWFHTDGTIFKNGIRYRMGSYMARMDLVGSSISLIIEILPAKPAEGS